MYDGDIQDVIYLSFNKRQFYMAKFYFIITKVIYVYIDKLKNQEFRKFTTTEERKTIFGYMKF